MSFLGFDLEKGKQDYLQAAGVNETEDVPVFTWGEESYDGLGDVLQEGGDELNEETFGDIGTVGKDFDFSNTTLPKREQAISLQNAFEQVSLDARSVPQDSDSGPDQLLLPSDYRTESIWGNKSPFFVLPRANDGINQEKERPVVSPLSAPDSRATSLLPTEHHTQSSAAHTGIRTLEEIEVEMRAAAQQSRARQEEFLLQRQMQFEEEERQRIMQEQELELQRQLLYQQEQHQLQMQRLLQQQREHQYQRTPPPRMLPASQSPRFLEHHRQLLLQQQQEQQSHQQRLQGMQGQLRLEEMERQLLARAALQQQRRQSPNAAVVHHRQPSTLSSGDSYNHQQRQQSQSPINGNHRYSSTPQESLVLPNPQNIQLQQRLLSEMAQAEFIRNIQGGSAHAAVEQEALRMEAMRKIFEAEMMEEKRRRKAAKIAHMSRYNDLMTQSDKDFITRIQVSQLVTQDPYADDFYAQVYGAILRSKMGLQSQDERVLKFGSGGGVGLGLSGPKGGTRRPSAMQRMEQQVERIVNNARKREEEKGIHAIQSLQGALGRTSGRSYKAAPRQLLQVDATSGASPTISPAYTSRESGSRNKGVEEAAKLGREALGNAADTTNLVRKEPLTQREILSTVERIYDLVLQVEQLKRDQPMAEEEQQMDSWQKQYDGVVDQIWDALKVMVPLETSDPHPFISLLGPGKGKKVLSRITRHLSDQRMLTLLTLLVACFHQLDVVKQASVLDYVQDTWECVETERQTQGFLGSVLQSILPVVAKASLRLVTGLLGLLLDRSDVIMIAGSRVSIAQILSLARQANPPLQPGLALLTLFLSRVEVIKQNMAVTSEVAELPSPEEAQQWYVIGSTSSVATEPLTPLTKGSSYSTIFFSCLRPTSFYFFHPLALRPRFLQVMHKLTSLINLPGNS
ncbi:hypothetical protein AX15_002145 [Amanita polypyramis BW_CC]|nr:hypothetical protein AX15_002145 [Amanita polypyramis BW_CC]